MDIQKIEIEQISKQNSSFWENYAVPISSSRIQCGLSLIPSDHKGSVLDIGCADGSIAKILIDKGWESFGIDINPQNARLALQKSVFVTIGNLTVEFPYKDQSFDLIVAFEVVEHLVDTRRFLKECYRTLKQNGYLIITTPNLASISNRIRLMFGMYPAWMDYEVENGSGHVRYYTNTILKSQTESLGFHFDKSIGSTLPIPIISRINKVGFEKIDFLKILGQLFPNLSSHIIFRLKK